MKERNNQMDIPKLTASMEKLAVALEKRNALDEKRLMLEHKKFLFEQHKYRSDGGKSTPVFVEETEEIKNEEELDIDSLDISDFQKFLKDKK